MGIGDILGSLGRATSQQLPGIMQRGRERAAVEQQQDQKEKNRRFGGDFHTAMQGGDEEGMQRLINEAPALGVDIEGINAASKAFSTYKKDGREREMDSLKLQIQSGGDPSSVNNAKFELYKYLNPDATQDDLDARRAALTAHASQQQQILDAQVATAGFGAEKAGLDVKALREAYEKGPKVKVKWTKNDAGDHEIRNAETGQLIRTLTLTYDNMPPPVQGALGGHKLSRAQLKQYEGLGAEQKKKVAQIATGSQMIDRLKNLLGDDEVAEHLGKWGGTITDIEAWVTGSAYLPDRVIEYNALLYDMVDLSLRERSGAAVTPHEVYAAMEKIIGGTTTSPGAILKRLNTRQETNRLRIMDISGGLINFAEMERVAPAGPATGPAGPPGRVGVGTVLRDDVPPTDTEEALREQLAAIENALRQ